MMATLSTFIKEIYHQKHRVKVIPHIKHSHTYSGFDVRIQEMNNDIINEFFIPSHVMLGDRETFYDYVYNMCTYKPLTIDGAIAIMKEALGRV